MIVANALNYVIKLDNHQRIAKTRPPPAETLDIKTDEYSPFLVQCTPVNSVNVAHYKLTLDLLQYMKKYATVQQNNDNCINNGWRDEVTVAKKYKEDSPEFLYLLKDIAYMRNGHLWRTTGVNHQIELTDKSFHPVQSAPYRTGPTEGHSPRRKSTGSFNKKSSNRQKRNVQAQLSLGRKRMALSGFLLLSQTRRRKDLRLVAACQNGRLY